ncbi:FadR/GntR family transcriptional regulator [Croceicoccus naphthovorans]|uniref:GntR family transcriptional regulator n=1 Tax=Croceicoccus naphthovorans TaxID=1348774 RepID=A0A0G3XE07_9SPHN|nr:FadR/GntR family transcriptional regulator [Croceicoccus naphthovorans]AKM09432.1 GntR family transcriptional regulator [Croceicoccus naphthovorans]MBB3991940.1 DNA-binding FadR family transcriptional regulator [Croceicoccus naphthovorans]
MRGKRLYQDVARQIVDLVQSGEFPPGSRLPGERDLAERLGVSRVTIREAEIALQAIGKLEIKTGSGVYVRKGEATLAQQLPSVSAFEVTEARLLVESEAAALAARNISDEEIAELGNLVDTMGKADSKTADEADEKFHLLIARASNNAALMHVIGSLWRMREDLPAVKATYESVCVHDAQERAAEHREVYDALANRDPAAARGAMRSHFQRLIESMLDTTERQALAELQQKANESRERYLASATLQ